MFVRADEHRCVVPARPLPFARWIHEGHELGWPTLDDFAYHLTTLFPPVRPRGWLELRVVDALPDAWWPVAVAVTTALLDDAEGRRRGGAARRGRCGAACRRRRAPRVLRSGDRRGRRPRASPPRCPALARIGADPATIAAAEDVLRAVRRARPLPGRRPLPVPRPLRLPAAT